MAPLLPLAKLAGVFVKQISKPVSAKFINHAQAPGKLQDLCCWLGQGLHTISTVTIRMSQNEDRYLTKYNVVSVDNLQIPKGSRCRILQTDGNRVQVKVKIDKHEVKTWIPKKVEDGVAEKMERVLRRQDVPKLPKAIALDRGATFFAEVIVLGTASIVILEEFVRALRKESQLMTEKEEKRKEKERLRKQDAERRDTELIENKRLIEELKLRVDELDRKQANRPFLLRLFART
eukprot:GEMP01042788.1.p1 GENE.GEMP01042788.1~~GEMP01042788.1.p1  ORF type:complete len:234 (+),score=46.87 GEMP01042788.1:74-775(+)